MSINSRQKGARAERQFRDLLRAEGYLQARRGQQFSGSPESPDVVCPELEFLHWEIKAVERLNIEDAMAQARRDCGASYPGLRKVPVVAHKRNFRPWLITMDAENFFRFLRGELPPVAAPLANRTDSTPHPGPMTHSRPLVRPDGPSTSRIPSSASQAAGVPDRGGEGDGAKGTALPT